MTTIGLFGTCGSSVWRKNFISCYEAKGIAYFNPQVGEGEWHPGMVEEENRHLAEDEIVLFPVTSESTGSGSLAEIGFSIAHALRLNRNRFFVFMIDDACSVEGLDPAVAKENVKTRALTKSKLKDMAKVVPNVFYVESLTQMLDVSLSLVEALNGLHQAEARSATLR